jgi:hypothetical protein
MTRGSFAVVVVAVVAVVVVVVDDDEMELVVAEYNLYRSVVVVLEGTPGKHPADIAAGGLRIK